MSATPLYDQLAAAVGQSFEARPVAEPEPEAEAWELCELADRSAVGEIGGAKLWQFSALFKPPQPRPSSRYLLSTAAGDPLPELLYSPVIDARGLVRMELVVASADAALVGNPDAEVGPEERSR